MDAIRKDPNQDRYALEATRRSLHGVAESLLGGHQWRTTGTIRLQVSPAGFRTGPLDAEGAYLAVEGTDLVVSGGPDGAAQRRIPLQGRLCELAEQAGVSFGPPESYTSTLGSSSSDRVRVDAHAATLITRAFELGDQALRTFAARHPGGDAAVPVLWPEHFDLGISLDEVNYGVSAGDDTIPEPYAYVGPWRQRRGPFWDQPFGATYRVQDLAVAADLVTFFERGRTQASTDPAA